MKKVVLALMLFSFLQSVSAQDFEIVSVESLAADMSAREEMKTDYNDRQCALLRVATQNIVPEQREKFVFKADLGSEVVERASRNGEIWLWVSPGLKYLRIQHPDLGQYELRFLDYVNRVEALHTYKITIKGTLSLPLQEQGNNAPTQQYLAFRISPANATLFVNDEQWEVSPDGSAMKFVNFGTYNYQVHVPNYHTEVGKVTTIGSDKIQTVNITLKPNYGWIEVSGENNCFGASVYINNSYAGKTPFKSKAIGCGQYKVCVVKDKFDIYCETTTVSENETSRVTPTLIASTINYSDDSNGNNTAALLGDAKYGIVNGEFSVGPTNKVYFSKGNLQYQASTNSWRFAEKQWDYIGEANQNISETYNGWIDLFGWGTGNNPSRCTPDRSYYKNYVEWGNNISDKRKTESRWRTLTKDEWKYLFNSRKTSSGVRYVKAKVNYTNGVIIFPDNWRADAYNLNKINDSMAAFSTNLITVSDWGMLESLGAVFLPSAGDRKGTTVNYSGIHGKYWTESGDSVFFNETFLNISSGGREYGSSVRLVCDFK